MVRPNLGLFLRTSLPLLAASALITACGNKDGDPSGKKETDEGTGGNGMGGEINQPPPPIACEEDSECDDYFYCNGEERCVDNLCRQGERVDCEDGIGCTIDRCIEDSQECESEAPDEDGDGHADASCLDDEENPLGDDCNDDDSLSYPGSPEICDAENRDEDCNPNTIGTLDADRDGFIDAMCCNPDEDGDLSCGDDCDDTKTNVNPAATEACDFLDNNCDGETDEGVSLSMYEDKDHDAHGDDDAGTVQTCAGAVGYAAIGGDCDDEDPEVFEGQFEICDDKDNNCNGVPDEVRELAPWYKDADEDGYGDPESTPVFSCYRVPGRVLSQNDCKDDRNTVNPNATEICDGLDNNCNGTADFKLPGNNNFEDDDSDGAADSECGGDDCNDTDGRTSAGAEEVCDRIDNDCDGEVDEQTVQNIWYIDEDGDGWGVVIGSALASCDPIPDRASQFGDCDDTDRDVKPGVAEICDGFDQDCDGIVDEGAAVHCEIPNALSTCRFGECAVFSCLPGFVDDPAIPGPDCDGEADPLDYETTIPCTGDTGCSDGDLCTGIETCVEGFCRLGNPIACGAGPTVIQGNFTISDGRDILDLEGIDLITGDLIIDSTQLSSLIGLETLRVIGGDLIIRSNSNLVRLSGSALSNLEVVGGDIVIEGNPKLTSASLPSLVSTNSLIVYYNDSLEVLSGFENLAVVDKLLRIEQNSALTEISEFESLGRIGGGYDQVDGDCAGEGGLEILNNSNLISIDAFSSVGEIEGDLCVLYNYQLPEVAFENLQNVGLSVVVLGQDSMGILEVPVLSSIGSRLAVGGGEGVGLAAISLPALVEIGGDFSYSGNSAILEDFSLPVLVEIGGDFSYSGNSAILQELSLPALAELGGTLGYSGSDASLQELSFPSLVDAGGVNLTFFGSGDALVNVDFSALEATGSLSISYSATEATFPVWEFPELLDVEQDVTLTLTAPVTSVSAPLLQNAGSLLISVASDFLETLDFPSLEQTTGNLSVTATSTNTNVLTDVDFGSLTAVATLDQGSGLATFNTPTTDLDIGLFTTVGQNNTGTITLNVAPFDVCPDVARIYASGFLGVIIDDMACQ